MPATIALGKTATFKFTEWSGLGGTGSPVPPDSNVIYISSNTAVATINQAGLVLGIKAGKSRILGLDPVNDLDASDVITVK